jgi:hypothetical protein
MTWLRTHGAEIFIDGVALQAKKNYKFQVRFYTSFKKN